MSFIHGKGMHMHGSEHAPGWAPGRDFSGQFID